MKEFIAHFRYRENGILHDNYKTIQANSLKDAKTTAKALSEQYGWWYMDCKQDTLAGVIIG